MKFSGKELSSKTFKKQILDRDVQDKYSEVNFQSAAFKLPSEVFQKNLHCCLKYSIEMLNRDSQWMDSYQMLGEDIPK